MSASDAFGDLPGPDEEPIREDGAESRDLEEKEVQVVGVFEHTDETTSLRNPFVLLRDNQGRCVLIWVGKFEAFAISMALEGESAERPLTHDLLKNVTERLGAQIERVVVDDLWGETFYAKVWLSVGGKLLSVDSRPSDGLAIALRAKCPVYMTEAVLQEASRPCEDIEGI